MCLVSIIVPVYNRPHLVRLTLESIQAQTLLDWEAIVVDDQSTDDTYDVLESLAATDSRFKIISNTDGTKGAPGCRNIGIENSTGKYVLFLDSDDIISPTCLEKRVHYMNTSPDVDFAVFQSKYFKESPGDIDLYFNLDTGDNPLDRFLNNDLPWAITGPIYRMSAIYTIGPWDESLICGQDIDYGIRSLCHNLNYRVSDQIDYYIRVPSELKRPGVGHNTWEPPRLPSHERRVSNSYHAIVEGDLMTDHRRLLLLGNHLLVAKAWREHGDTKQAESVWNAAVARGLITTFKQRLSKLYLFNYPTFIAPFAYYTLYHILPKAVFVPRRFSIKFKADFMDSKPVKPHNATRGPLYNHSGIIEKGLARYVLDALVAIVTRRGSAV